MPQESKQVMECSLEYLLTDIAGQETSSGEALARLEEENLAILPRFGEALFLSYRDILGISEGDYKIRLTLNSKEDLLLSNLGYRYEEFFRVLNKLRNEILLGDMLMRENLRRSGVEAEFVYWDESGKERGRGKCEPRLYETAIVVIPEKGDFTRIPYSDLWEISEEDYNLVLATEYGQKIVLSKMGDQFDPFAKALSVLNNELQLKVQSSLKELLQEAFGRAQNEAKGHFHRCPKCTKWVCENDWNEQEGLCVEDAPRVSVEVAAAKAKATEEQIWEKAAATQLFTGQIESKQTICPQCGKPAGEGKFCTNCGGPLALIKCPKCGAQNPVGTNFCGECGTKLL